MHATREANIAELKRLAQRGDWESVYQQHVLYEFAAEARMGFQLAFLRTFCDPAMAKILVEAGRIEGHAAKRAYDTGIVIHEIISEGTRGRRARRMIAHMNRQHHHFPSITPTQMTYVLAAFVVVPMRYIERSGWRQVLDIEKHSAAVFYDHLGALMGIKERATTYEEACFILDEYEREHLHPDNNTLLLGRKSIEVIAARLPKPLRPLSGQLFASQIADERVSRAVGLPTVRPGVRAIDRVFITARRAIEPLRPARSSPSFTPGQPSGTAYPDGYTLEMIEKP